MKVTVRKTVTLELDDDESRLVRDALFIHADTPMPPPEALKLREVSAALAYPEEFMAGDRDRIIGELRDRLGFGT